jgi:hypothetical protein
VAESADDVDPDVPVEWAGLPSPELVRAALALLLAAGVSVLGAFILGEYEFDGFLPLGAGLLFGVVLGEITVEVGRRRTVPVALWCAALTAAGLLGAGWIAGGEGLAPIPGGAYLAAAVGAAAAALRVVGLRRS